MTEEIMYAIKSIKLLDFRLESHIFFDEKLQNGIKIITDDINVRRIVEEQLSKQSMNILV